MSFQHVIARHDGLCYYALIRQLFEFVEASISDLLFFFHVEKNTKNYSDEIDGLNISLLKSNPFILFIAFCCFKCSTFHSISTPTNQNQA